jgi:uncharacterized protein involved in exopolysaccharide biosynthesis
MAYEIALPEEESRTFGDYLDALKRRRKPAIALASALLVAGLLAIFLWPNAYTSSAVILIEDPDVPPGLVPTTVTTFAARQVQYINQRVMTRTNLANIIEKFELFPEERKYLPTLLLVPDVEKDMSIDVIDVQQANQVTGQAVTSTIAFRLAFEHENPGTARQVANELVSLYLAENVRARTEQTAETSQFMQEEVTRLDQEVQELEAQIAAIKQANEGALPELVSFNMQNIAALDRDILEIDRQIQSLTENKIMLDAQLASLSPVATTVLPDGRAVVAPEEQLKALQTQLAMMEGRYSADHPDVVRVKRDLAAVQAQLGSNLDLTNVQATLANTQTELAKAREQYGPAHPEVQALERQVAALQGRAAASRGTDMGSLRADNPAYVQIRAQRDTLTANERSLRAKQAQIRAQRADLEAKTLRSSDVEKDLSALYRKLNSASASYQAARERAFAAKMGQALETQSKGERFALVEPPDLPLQPSSPNRPVMLALLLVLVLAVGLGWPQVAESMDQSVTSARVVERVQGAPPIAEIPFIETEEDRQHDTRVRTTALFIAPGLALVALVLVHFFFIPLDVLWYVALRKLGM